MHLPSFVRPAVKLFTAVALAGVSLSAAAQTFTPPAVSTSSRSTPITGYSQILQVDISNAGTIVFAQPQNGQLLASVNGAAPTVVYTVPTGGGGYPKGVAADNLGNGYITDYSGHLWQVNLTSGAATDILAPCGSLFGYYLGTQTVTVDASNNVYTAGNGSGSGSLPIVKITPAGACSTVATGDGNSLVAADGLGNVYYTTGSANIFRVAPGSSTPTLLATGFTALNGIHADAVGNLYVSDANTVDELPYISGAPSAAARFVVLPYTSAQSVGTNALGQIVTSDGSSISVSTPGALSFGSVAKGVASTTAQATLFFNAAEVLTGFRTTAGASTSAEVTNTGAGTCAAGAYTAGSSCTLALTFTPSTTGLRQASVQALAGPLAVGTLTVSAQGTGAALTLDPGTQSTLGSGFTTPSGIAVDASGNTAVADSTANTVSFFAAGSTTTSNTFTGLNKPSAVAFAADGSLYIADTGAGSILLSPRSTTGTFGTLSTVVTGLSAPTGVAVDNTGALFVADKTNLFRFPNNAGTVDFSTRLTLSSTLTAAGALSIDPSGNLLVADTGAGSILRFTGTASTTLLTGLTAPTAAAAAPSGSLFIASATGTSITRVPFTSGAYNLNSAAQLGTGLSSPAALALDNAGNLFIADSKLPGVVRIARTAATLDLGKFNLGSSSATQSLTLANSGTAALTFGSPLYTTSGNTADFAITATGTSACSGGGTLITGSSCTVSATFTPTASGARSETLTFSSNAANASSLSATLTGTGINLPKTTTTLTQTPAGGISFGQSVQVTATVALQTGTGTPTGTVQFYVNGTAYGAAVTLASSTASQTLTGLPAGSNTVSAVYSGDANYAGSTATALTIAVALAPTSTTLTSSISSATPVLPSTTVTLTARVSTGVTTSAPSGTVTFTGNGQTIGTVALNSGTATYTGLVPAGTYTITATYSGDSGFAASTSNAVSVSVRAADFDISNAPTALTVHAPGTVTTSFTVTPISTYTGGIDLACSGLPANTQCTFVPAVISFQNSNGVAPTAKSIQLVITTDQAPASTVAWLLPLGGLGLFAAARRRKLPRALAAVLACAALFSTAALSGCGNSNSAVTPTGTSTVTVTLTGTPTGTSTPPTSGTGNIIKTFSFPLTVN